MEDVKFIGLCLVFIMIRPIASQYETSASNTATVKEYVNEYKEDGGYKFRFVLSDGTEREESGYQKPDGSYFVSGYYTYTDPKNGEKQYVNYYADKTGYHPSISGAPAIPTPEELEVVEPPIVAALPPAAVASLLG